MRKNMLAALLVTLMTGCGDYSTNPQSEASRFVALFFARDTNDEFACEISTNLLVDVRKTDSLTFPYSATIAYTSTVCGEDPDLKKYDVDWEVMLVRSDGHWTARTARFRLINNTTEREIRSSIPWEDENSKYSKWCLNEWSSCVKAAFSAEPKLWRKNIYTGQSELYLALSLKRIREGIRNLQEGKAD
jgi:hypothetical protein